MEKDKKDSLPINNIPRKNFDKKANIDTSRFIIKQKLKLDTTRIYTPIVTITERERRQFNQSISEPNINSALVEKARNAIKVAESHIREEALKQEKNITKKAVKSNNTSIDNAEKIKEGNFEFGFDALIGSSDNLEDKV